MHELDLPFPPGLAERLRREPVGLHLVVAHLGEHLVVLADEFVHRASGAQPHHGHQCAAAEHRAHEVEDGLRDVLRVLAQRLPNLATLVNGDRELEVPAGVVSPGAAAQGQPPAGEDHVDAVVVEGIEVVLDGRLHVGDARQVVQGRQRRRRVDVESAFNLGIASGSHASV